MEHIRRQIVDESPEISPFFYLAVFLFFVALIGMALIGGGVR